MDLPPATAMLARETLKFVVNLLCSDVVDKLPSIIEYVYSKKHLSFYS